MVVLEWPCKATWLTLDGFIRHNNLMEPSLCTARKENMYYDMRLRKLLVLRELFTDNGHERVLTVQYVRENLTAWQKKFFTAT